MVMQDVLYAWYWSEGKSGVAMWYLYLILNSLLTEQTDWTLFQLQLF